MKFIKIILFMMLMTVQSFSQIFVGKDFDADLVFRETFQDEWQVRFNGGDVTDIDSYNPATFNGSSSTVQLNELKSLNNFSIRIKCTFNNLSGTLAFVGGSAINNYLRVTSSTTIDYRTNEGATSFTLPSALEVDTNYEIVLTRSGASNIVYLGGVSKDTEIRGGVFNIHELGSRSSGSSDNFNGSIDLIEIYNIELSAQDVSDLYSGVYSENYPNPDSLVFTSGEKLGSEEITNGNFATDSDWVKGTGWTIVGGVALYDGVATSLLRQAQSLGVGNKYRVTFTVTKVSRLAFYDFDGATPLFEGGSYDDTYAVGIHTFSDIASVSDGIGIIGFLGSLCGIDNISVKQILKDSSTVHTRSSITHFHTPKTTSKSTEQLAVDGDFNSTDGWTADANATLVLAGGYGKITGITPPSVTGYVSQEVPTEIGKTYIATCNYIPASSTGELGSVHFGDQEQSVNFLGGPRENFSLTYTAISSTTTFKFGVNAEGGNYLSFDNVSIKDITYPSASYNMIASNGQVLVDISENGNNGTIVNCDQTIDGLNFDGSSSYVSIPDDASLDFGAGSFTIEWTDTYPQTQSANWAGIIAKGNAGAPAKSWQIGHNDGSPDAMAYLEATDGGGTWTTNVTLLSGITDGTHKFVLTRDVENDSLKLFQNGVQVYSSAYTADQDLTNTIDLFLKSSSSGVVSSGLLQEVNIYSRALPESEIIAKYNSQIETVISESFEYSSDLESLRNWISGTGTYEVETVDTDEKVSNGDFTAWTADNPDGWGLNDSEDATNYVTQNGNACRLISDNTKVMGIYQSILTTGKTYFVQINVTDVTVGAISPKGSASISTVGLHEYTFTATSAIYNVLRVGVTDITFTDVSVTEVSSNYVTNGSNYFNCTSAGTTGLNVNLDYVDNGYITYDWLDASGTNEWTHVTELVSASSIFTYADNLLTLTLATGDKVANILVKSGQSL